MVYRAQCRGNFPLPFPSLSILSYSGVLGKGQACSSLRDPTPAVFSAWTARPRVCLWLAPTPRIVSARMSAPGLSWPTPMKNKFHSSALLLPTLPFPFLDSASPDSLCTYLCVYYQFLTEPGTEPGTQNTANKYLLNELLDKQLCLIPLQFSNSLPSINIYNIIEFKKRHSKFQNWVKFSEF